jgi:hypothetical protein
MLLGSVNYAIAFTEAPGRTCRFPPPAEFLSQSDLDIVIPATGAKQRCKHVNSHCGVPPTWRSDSAMSSSGTFHVAQ